MMDALAAPGGVVLLAAAGGDGSDLSAETWGALLDLLVLLGVAMLLGALAERLRQSAILGYLLAGSLLGPGVLDVVSSRGLVDVIAELGVALLLFSIGLEFSWPRLKALGRTTLYAGILQVGVTLVGGIAVALVFGPSIEVAIAVGATVALSSTACVLRVLVERAELESVHGRLCLGILLFQDVATLPLVLLVTALGGEGGFGARALSLLGLAGAAVLLALGFQVAAAHLLPRLLRETALSKNRDLPILLATVTSLGAAWAAHAVGLSPPLGAFIAGMLLGGSPFATQVRADVGPLRTLFVTLFFASIGMFADPELFLDNAGAIVAVVAAIVFGKAFVIWLVTRPLSLSHRYGVATGLSLAQVGEFSFVVASVALAEGVIPGDLFNILVSATIATLFMTPFLVALAVPVGTRAAALFTRLGWRGPGSEVADEVHHHLRDHVIVIGYGPAGEGVVDALARLRIPNVIVELNPDTVERALERGLDAVLGDAAHGDVLEHVNVGSARAVVVTLPDHRAAIDVIRAARARSPHLAVITRARYHVHARALARAGSQVVVDEEREVGRLLGSDVVARLGDQDDADVEAVGLS